MKIAILAAGYTRCFPLFVDKPKCLYHLDGEVQLERVIKVAEKFVDDEDIIVVAGYKCRYIYKYLKDTHPSIDYRVNENYLKSAIFSLRKAIEGVSEDVVFMLADENVSEDNVRKICQSKRKMALLCHDKYYYYSVGIMKLDANSIGLINDDNYLNMEYMKKVYCFAENKEKYDGLFNINSGVCLGYTTIDLVRRIGKIEKIENPVESYHGNDVDFIHYNPDVEYIPDIDYFSDTDEYETNKLLRFYNDFISEPIKVVGRFVKKILRKLKLI